MAGPSIDAAPYVPDAETPTSTSPDFITREQILNSSKPHWDILTDKDKKCISTEVYLGDNDPVSKLTTELKENLRDTEGNRTPNFQKLVDLGLLFPQPTCTILFGLNRGQVKYQEPLRSGCQLPTHKGADFLGIDLGTWVVAPEIQVIQKSTQEQVESLQRNASTSIASLVLFGQIMSAEPLLLTQNDPKNFLTRLMYAIRENENRKISNIHHNTLLLELRYLGWIADDIPGHDSKTLGELLTEDATKYLREYKKIYGEKAEQRVY